MNYPKKTGYNLYQSRHRAYITYSVKTWFLKILSVSIETQKISKKLECVVWGPQGSTPLFFIFYVAP